MWLLRARSGIELRDLGPMRAARRQDLLDLAIADRAFGYPLEMVLRAARRDWRIVELPVTYRPRTGDSKVTGTVRGTARAARDMTRLLAGALALTQAASSRSASASAGASCGSPRRSRAEPSTKASAESTNSTATMIR